jgi:hypothetical protein
MQNIKLWSPIATAAVVLSLSVSPLAAQITGELRGLVLDPTGAAMREGEVTLESLETAERRVSHVNAGLFAFPLLKIGAYSVSVHTPGFRTARTDADVKAGEITSLRMELQVGPVTESVDVTDAVSLLATQSAQRQISITGRDLLEIPVNRDSSGFALTGAGVSPVMANNASLLQSNYSINGSRYRSNNVTVDGVTSTDVADSSTGGVITPLIFNTIKEVKLVSSNFNSEYGRNAGSQLLMLTQNGSNQLHGELFDYFQNDRLNARQYFDRTGKANKLRDNTFGFVLGGPLPTWKTGDGANRVFWLGAYERQEIRGVVTGLAKAPTQAMLNQVTDPTSLSLLDQYRVPTSPSGTLSSLSTNVQSGWKLNLRGDVVLSATDALWVRYGNSSNEVTGGAYAFLSTFLPGFGAGSDWFAQQLTAQELHQFSPAVVNEARFGFGSTDPEFFLDSPYRLGPAIQFFNNDVSPFGQAPNMPQGRKQRTFQFTDNVSWTAGAHQIKFGGDYHYIQRDSFDDSGQRGLIYFLNWGDFAAGRPVQLFQFFGNAVRRHRVHNFFGFLQDDWRITRSLTLNVGLRMERAGGTTEADGVIANLNLSNRSPIGVAGSGPLGVIETGEPSFRGNTNWAPRVGFAWSPGSSGQTVVRGGYSIAYDFLYMQATLNQRFLPPFIQTAQSAGPFTGDNSLAHLVAGDSAIQNLVRGSAGVLRPDLPNFGAISPAIDPGIKNPQMQNWSLGVETQRFGLVWKAAYVGTKGTYLTRFRPLNLINAPRPATDPEDELARQADFRLASQRATGSLFAPSNRYDPRYDEVNWLESSANSSFHSAQFEVGRRFSTLLVSAAYHYGKSLDDNSEAIAGLISDDVRQQNPANNRDNHGPSQFDNRHRLVVMHQWTPSWGRRSSNWFVRSALADWGFSGIASVQSGVPVTFLSGSRLSVSSPSLLTTSSPVRPNTAGPFEFSPRPIGSAGVIGVSGPSGRALSNYAASLGLSQPLLGNIGNLGRGTHRLNGITNANWSLFKNVPVRESVNLQIRGDFYNLFNNTSFQDVDRTINSTTFGQYTRVGQNPRSVTLAARLVF